MKKETYTLITGASAGIGKRCAELLAAQGNNLILVARRKEALEQMKESLESEHGVTVAVYKTDLSDVDQINHLFDSLEDYPIDVLINNAGFALGKSSFEEYEWDDISKMIDVNIRAATRVAQLAIPFLKQTQGHIVNLSSVSGIEAYEGGAVYCGTKAYVKMMSRGLRIDLAGTGVRVTDIAPGAVDTEFSLVRFKGDADKAAKVYEGYRALQANDVAEAIVFAVSRPAHVNIDTIHIMPTDQASATRFVKK